MAKTSEEKKYEAAKEKARRELSRKVVLEAVDIPGLEGKMKTGSTTAYEVFVIFDSNRDIDTSRAEKISASIRKTGQNMMPILVDKNFNVIDGQHRLAALMALELPVFFIMYLGDMGKSDLMVEVNKNMKNLTLDDYFKHNAAEGIDGYTEALDVKNKYKIDISSLERFLPVTTSQIKDKVPFSMPEDIDFHVSTAISIKEAERKVLSNSRRLYKWASAMMFFENRINERIKESKGFGMLADAWKKDGYTKVIKYLPKVIKDETSGDGTKTLASLLSKAFDYNRKHKFRIVETN